jgi:DNA polymerase-3 subunit gamma/tau
VVFIFATTEAHKIPTTILSRCQRYDFKLIPTARLTSHLESVLVAEKIPFSADGLLSLARQAGGSVRDGLSLLDQVIAYVGAAGTGAESESGAGSGVGVGTITREIVSEVLGVADRAVLVHLARAVLARDAAAALRTLNAAVERGLDLGQMSRSFLGLLRDIEVVARVSEPDDLIDATADELGELRALAATAGGLTPVLFDRWARAVEESGRATAPRLILEMAAVDLCEAEPLEPLGDLIDRLEGLEARLQAGEPPRGPGDGGRATHRPTPAASPPAAPPRPVALSSIPAPAPAPLLPRGIAPAPAQAQAPAPAPALSVGTPSPSDRVVLLPAEAWRRAKSDLERRRPRIGALLANAHVWEIDASKVVLGFEDRADVDAAERVRVEIEQALSSGTGSPVRLVTRQDKRDAAVVPVIRAELLEEADALSADKHTREQEARQHPIIQKAQDLFGVAIREIKT